MCATLKQINGIFYFLSSFHAHKIHYRFKAYFLGGGSHSRSAHVTCALFWYLKVLGITVLKLENLIILLIMAFMKYFEKDLLKWHNMNDISYVLMFLIFILQGIFLYKNPLTYHKGG